MNAATRETGVSCFGINTISPNADTAGATQRTARRLCGASTIVALLISLVLTELASSQDAFISREYTIKAAYVYNFGKYITWPDDAAVVDDGGRKVFVIGIVGESPLRGAIHKLSQTKQVQGMPIVVHTITQATDEQRCHVVFFPANAQQLLTEAIVERLSGSPILIVGETAAFARRRGGVGFVKESNKLKFEVNNEALRRAGLEASAKLLRLGRIVSEEE